MKNLVKLAFLAGCFAASSVNATAVKWTGLMTVTSVQVVNTGGIIIYLDSEVNTACTKAGTNSIYVYQNQQGLTENGLDAFRSSAFVALTSGLKANILYDDSTPDCFGKYIVISKR